MRRMESLTVSNELKETEPQLHRRGPLCISFYIVSRRSLMHQRRVAACSTSRPRVLEVRDGSGSEGRGAVEECDAVIWGA
ncbi:hypothetical protein BV22DRAFT_861452 [Leucogyrophana mollusca]|uniref:Uncharacterized protein n=1 Tax=Leucogyrophana mollusca TaxID=85980 RepID=A0ACB8B1H4_9AGAM|nr:hypothetical protein BV22DRAFT_861452 [Leucogyrophana mollusca]